MKYHLTKKYRSKFLSEIIGQPFISQFLLNSLYKNFIYPLYLFSGMRGTGKTSTARIFSISMLCEKYEVGKIEKLPCYQCQSCVAFLDNRHPDIIELDAASNNGVETIRSLIENVSIYPVFGKRKFYIIDEVHMLSKAAFNACLKVMEEPPEHVCFILATTEFQKVLETIRSRSVILQFNPIENEILKNYIKEISKKENIEFDDVSIDLICKVSEGSVRDALNYLEKFRTFSNLITKEIVCEELGILDIFLVSNYLNSVLNKDLKEYFIFKKQFSKNFSNNKIFWNNIIFELQKKINQSDFNNKIFEILKFFYDYEKIFINSINPIGILDLCFFKINGYFKDEKIENNFILNEDLIKIENKIEIKENKIEIKVEKKILKNEKIENFINLISEKEKPLSIIFSRAKITTDENNVNFIFLKSLQFYKNFLQEKEQVWKAIFYEIFGSNFSYNFSFEESNEENKSLNRKENLADETIKVNTESDIDLNFNKNKINNIEKGKIATEIVKFFSGNLSIVERKYEKK